ncbi:hypothetical protein L218DRAFT_887261, partial [Marasmius fiardii PR-910]
LTVQGSVTWIHHACMIDVEYQGIWEQQQFDVLNLILGTPFLFQHQVVLGFNPTCVFIGLDTPLPIMGEGAVEILSSAAEVVEENIDHIRRQLLTEIQELCKSEDEVGLPPLRVVNYRIPIIEPLRKYPYHPSKVPEVLRPLWNKKHNLYMQLGR